MNLTNTPVGYILIVSEIPYRGILPGRKWKVSDRPFYDEMSDDEKKEIRKYSEDMGLPYEFIKFSKSTV